MDGTGYSSGEPKVVMILSLAEKEHMYLEKSMWKLGRNCMYTSGLQEPLIHTDLVRDTTAAASLVLMQEAFLALAAVQLISGPYTEIGTRT